MKKKIIHSIVDKVERNIDRLTVSRRNKKAEKEGVQIRCYHAYMNHEFAFIQGRVLGRRNVSEAELNDHLFTNIKRTFKLFYSKEISDFALQVKIGEQLFETKTDDEGYFNFQIPISSLETSDKMWQTVTVNNVPKEGEPQQEKAWIQAPSPLTDQIIVSDIDDTILQSGAHSMLTMIKNTFAENAKTRLSFDGVDDVYKKLQNGKAGQAVNPIFYLSNSPWNLYDFLVEFMDINDIPKGTLFLRDWGIDENKWFKDDGHKLKTIRKLLAQYPDKKFILIGDSGEKDPEYYHEIATESPDRIRTIYIRNVTDEKRAESVAKLTANLAQLNVPLLLIDTSEEIEKHAVNHNWIS